MAKPVINVEEITRTSSAHPDPANKHAYTYKIRIDKDTFDIDSPDITGRQILEKAEKAPLERWEVKMRMKGGHVVTIGHDQVVDLTQPGIERFITYPLDQTEG